MGVPVPRTGEIREAGLYGSSIRGAVTLCRILGCNAIPSRLRLVLAQDLPASPGVDPGHQRGGGDAVVRYDGRVRSLDTVLNLLY